MNPLLVTIKTVYGNDLIYPSNQTAFLFLQLTGKKTFTYTEIETIKNLGYEVQISAIPVQF